jgi:alginate O-acetyltransferase complex protein AlgJ
MARAYQAALVFVFCTLLCLPGLTMLFLPQSPKLYGVAEVPFPAFQATPQWLTEFEDYFNANLGYKRKLIQIHNLLGYRVLRDLQSESVLVGRKNWLFLKQNHGWESFRSERPLAGAEERGWQHALERAEDWLAEQQIPFLLVIVPSKETVYPDFLPRSATRARSVTRLDEMLELLRENEIPHLELRTALLEARKHTQVYDSIDSHWNGQGARVGAQLIMQRVAELLHRPPSFAELNERIVPQPSWADLPLILSLDGVVTAPSNAVVPKQPRARRLEPPESVTDSQKAQTKRMVFEVADETLPSALILRDSFAEGLQPVLTEKFRRSVWIWTHKLDLTLVAREKPDIVIMETTERFLSDKPPRVMLPRRR